MKNKIFAGIMVFLLVGSIIRVWAQNQPAKQQNSNLGRLKNYQKEMRYMMYSYITIYAAGPKKTAMHAINLAMNRMEQIGNEMNPTNPKSPVYAFNHYGTPITNPDILKVVKAGLQISKATDGAFDITVHPLVSLWGFDTTSPHFPSKKKIQEALENVGYWHLKIHNGVLTKDKKSIEIDLGALTKGYAMNQAVKILRENGIKSALINAGGDVYALGRKTNGKMWTIGIKSPFGNGLLGYMKVEDLSISSSGDYEHFFIHNGKRYCHIFNPKTGYPIQGVAGTTVIGPDPMLSDAWGTALFVMGTKGFKVVNKIPHLEAFLVTTSYQLWSSKNLRKDLEKKGKDLNKRGKTLKGQNKKLI